MKLSIDIISRYAAESMLQEVLATPKPGLVDRNNCGAHHDMDLDTFKCSIAALAPFMHQFAEAGQRSAGQDLALLFAELRRTGINAEKEMFRATGGVNTHKGMLFSMGLLCGAAGRILAGSDSSPTPESLCDMVAAMTKGLCDREFAGLDRKMFFSPGERVYMRYGEKGARGEAESGFENVRLFAYPMMESLFRKKISDNDVLVHTLIRLMSKVSDTNVMARHDLATARYVKKEAARIWEEGGMLSPQGRKSIELLDQEFIRKNISPGGCADLLAITLFLWFLCHH